MTIHDLARIRIIFNNTLEELSKTQSKHAWRILCAELCKIYDKIANETVGEYKKDIQETIYGQSVYTDTDEITNANMKKFYDVRKLLYYANNPMTVIIQKRRKKK